MRHANSVAVKKGPLGSHWEARDTRPIAVSSPPVQGTEEPQRVMWCAVGQHERTKCDSWSVLSGGILNCNSEDTMEDCIAAIAVRRAPPLKAGALPGCLSISLKAEKNLLWAAPHAPEPHPLPSQAPPAPAWWKLENTEQPQTQTQLWSPGSSEGPCLRSGMTAQGVVRAPVECESKSTFSVLWKG